MSQKLRLYYKNVTAGRLGAEQGITQEQFKALAQQTEPLIGQFNNDRKEGKTPYRDLPYDRKTVQQIKLLSEQLKSRCNIFVILGIGGSALGNIALHTALNSYMYNLDDARRAGPRFFVFDNIDPVQFGSFLDWVGDKLKGTVFNVISKSGRTAETASQFMIIHQMLAKRLGPKGLQENVIATTDPQQGILRRIARQENIRCLDIPDGVGGRFSVLSSVGLFGAVMCGIDIDTLLAGARDMDSTVSDTDFFKNPAAINAAINYHYYNHGKRISVMMPYSYALKDLADWYRQLWAESLGKANNLAGSEVHIGPTPVKALGVTDQHSQLQLYREGPNDKLFTFLQVSEFARDLTIGPAPDCAGELAFLANNNLSSLLNSEKLATEYALLQDKRPTLTVLFDQVDAYSVGQFIYLFEVTTSLAAGLFRINAYDQPAVELGKQAAFALMGNSEYNKLKEQIQPLTELDEAFMV
ncbi:MAG: glucose-6-phosphate isomerase [Sedimentisphaerales bacterium]|nr:glucose-6-phosphate isomerase [Sedimentisphaerales bacterium]